MRPAGLLRVAALALIWGSGFLWIKISLRGFTPIQLTWARLALGAAVLLIVVVATRRRLPTGRHLWGHLTIAALLGNAIPYTLFGIAEQDVASSLAGSINATTPLWALVLAWAFRVDRRVGWPRLAGLMLGFGGALLIFAPGPGMADSHILGAALCLVASASYGASYVYIGRHLSDTRLAPIVLSAAQLVSATGLLTLAIPLDHSSTVIWRQDSVVSILVLGLLGTGAAYVLNYRIIADDGAVLASTVTYLLPVVAVALGGLLLDEPFTLQMAIGVVAVLGGVMLSRRTNTAAKE